MNQRNMKIGSGSRQNHRIGPDQKHCLLGFANIQSQSNNEYVEYYKYFIYFSIQLSTYIYLSNDSSYIRLFNLDHSIIFIYIYFIVLELKICCSGNQARDGLQWIGKKIQSLWTTPWQTKGGVCSHHV